MVAQHVSRRLSSAIDFGADARRYVDSRRRVRRIY